jgi:hypothetical protein
MAAAAFAVALLGTGSWSLDGVLGLAYSDAVGWLWLGIVAAGVVLALLLRVLFAPKKAVA